MRGRIYAENIDLQSGFIAFASNVLVHKPIDSQSEKFATILNPDSLREISDLKIPYSLKLRDGLNYMTIQVIIM